MAQSVSGTKPFSLVDSHCCKRVTFAAIKHVVSYRILPAARYECFMEHQTWSPRKAVQCQQVYSSLFFTIFVSYKR